MFQNYHHFTSRQQDLSLSGILSCRYVDSFDQWRPWDCGIETDTGSHGVWACFSESSAGFDALNDFVTSFLQMMMLCPPHFYISVESHELKRLAQSRLRQSHCMHEICTLGCSKRHGPPSCSLLLPFMIMPPSGLTLPCFCFVLSSMAASKKATQRLTSECTSETYSLVSYVQATQRWTSRCYLGTCR